MKKIPLIVFIFSVIIFSNHFSVFASPISNHFFYNDPPKGNAKISGVVIDSATKAPVPFATIALTNPNNDKPIDGTLCDENGKFSLGNVEEGNYKIVISFIGFNTKTIPNVRIDDKKDEINLGTIFLSPTVQLLKEVTIEAQKALIEEKVDRTVYNAESDATNKGGDATDVLRKVPGLSVDLDGNVSIRGSQSIKVLINNRPSTVTANNIADALKQIPSDLIKSVEVITSPSAKYDAEGSGGIINIITKKNTLEGFSLNIDGSAGYRGSNLGLNGNYKKGKMSFSLGGHGRVGYNITGSFKNNQKRFGEDGQVIENIQEADTRNQNAFGRYQLGWDYDINEKNYITSSVQVGLRRFHTFQDRLRTQNYENSILQGTNYRDIEINDASANLDVNLNYTHLFKKPQEEFSLLTQYSRNNRINDFFSNQLDSTDYSVIGNSNIENKSYNQEITIQTDYQNPIAKNQMLELGAKEIFRHVSSNNQFSNAFNYDQNVTSAYLSYTLNFLKNYSVKAGTRYEYTTINAKYEGQENISIPSYGVLVPSLNISKKLKNGSTLKAAYNRRIQRPSLQFLNPNIQTANNLNITIGNPNLRPEYTNNYELSYSTYIKKASVSLTSFMRNSNNAIQSIRDALGNDTIRTTYGNIGRENAYGFSLFTNINISNKFSLNGGTDIYYAVLKNNVSNPLYNASNEGWVASYRAFGNYNIAKGWGFQLFAFYRARQVQLQGYQGGFGIYSLSLKKDFNNKRGSIGFGAENFFTPSFKIRNELVTPQLNQRSTTVLHNMNFKINFSYRIGKQSANDTQRRRKKSVTNDDLKEGGDQSGSMQPTTAVPSASPSGSAPSNGPAKQGPPAGRVNDYNQGEGRILRRDSVQSIEDSTQINIQRDDSIKTTNGDTIPPKDSIQNSPSSNTTENNQGLQSPKTTKELKKEE